MLNFAFLPVVSFVIQALILSIFIVVFYSLKKTNQDIDLKTEAREINLQHFSTICEAITDVKTHLNYNASFKKTVEHTYDAIIGSPALSSQEAYHIECAILDLINQLKQEVLAENEASVKMICNDIEIKVAERNSLLRLNRHKR